MTPAKNEKCDFNIQFYLPMRLIVERFTFMPHMEPYKQRSGKFHP